MKLNFKFILGFLTIALFIAFVGQVNISVGRGAIKNYDAIVDEIVPAVIELGQVKTNLLHTQREIYSNILVEAGSEVFKLANERKTKWKSDYFEKSQRPDDRQLVYEIDKTETVVYQLGLDLIQEKKRDSQIGLKRTKEKLEKASERINQVIDRAVNARIQELKKGSESAEKAGNWAVVITYMIIFLSVLFAVIVGLLLARSVINPIGKLKNAAEKIGAGDLSSRVKHTSKDELGILAATFNSMAESMDQTNKQLKKALEDAERANRLKAEFLRNSTHELKTPMAIIRGMNDLVLDSDLSEDQRECAESIKEAADNLSGIINDILDFSKSTEGQLGTKSSIFDLQKVCEKVMTTYETKAKIKKLEYALDWDAKVPKLVIGDPGRVIQILSQLISNAIKFTEKGFVRLGVRATHSRVGESNILFTVTDTGIGIPDTVMPHIFDEMTQGDGSTTRRYGGLGIGLSVCKQLVELLKGDISVKSEEGKGTTFLVKLKMLLAAPHDDGGSGPSKAVKPTGNVMIDILLWDANQEEQKQEARMLQDLGCNVDVALNQETAIKMLRESPYDLFLFGCSDHDMDHSQQIAEGVKMYSLTRNVKVMALVPGNEEGDEAAYRKIGMHGVLKKPMTYQSFESVLKKIS